MEPDDDHLELDQGRLRPRLTFDAGLHLRAQPRRYTHEASTRRGRHRPGHRRQQRSTRWPQPFFYIYTPGDTADGNGLQEGDARGKSTAPTPP
jgi:hypothetical protein